MFVKKAQLLWGLFNGDYAFAGPFSATVDITDRCNLRCPGCLYHSPIINKIRPRPDTEKSSDISLSLWRKTCDELYAHGTNTLVITGEGEPLLYDQVFDLISIAKERGFFVILLTNGTKLDTRNMRFMVESQLDVLRVTIWANSIAEYRRTYPDADLTNYHRVPLNLKELAIITDGSEFRLQTVLLC
ncbi:radical SAM protein [candidate division CSSED10-310 bacterium]|uniref:Radical SAM protein n=1 Tax=candidate division CSSED10-310 bacterium TaxID=2855610 RepID=A0ABV6Z388_UNCC1